MTTHEQYLACPDCGANAVPASMYDWTLRAGHNGRWCEGDEADCPGCGKRIGVRVDGDEDYAVATPVVLCRACGWDEAECDCEGGVK